MHKGYGRIRTAPNPVLSHIQSIMGELAEENKPQYHHLNDDNTNKITQNVVSMHKEDNFSNLSHLQDTSTKQSLSSGFKTDWKLGDKILIVLNMK